MMIVCTGSLVFLLLLVGSSGSYADVNECDLGSHQCSDDAECFNTNGSYYCSCLSGFYGNGTSCTDIDECADLDGTNECDNHATCTNTQGSYSCECDEGYSGNGTECTDIDECEDGTNECDNHATCINTQGSYYCQCDQGYSGNRTECIDIDECEDGTNECDNHETCTNTQGSYYCQCDQGYSGNGTECIDIDECEEGTNECDNHATCTNTQGSYFCQCDRGYSGNGTECIDIDECEDGTNECDNHATCTNTQGSYYCAQCDRGYSANGKECIDIDECSEGTNECDNNATCSNTEGSYYCQCDKGYTGNGKECADIDECYDGTNECDDHATCNNTEGSYSCQCDQGYSGNGKECIDINECEDGTNECDYYATCTNTQGSYSCQCDKGYSGNGKECTDVNECSLGTDECDEQAYCFNSEGSYTCTCKTGFTGDGKNCSDINECEDSNGGCSHTCVNAPGSYHCACTDPGFSLDNDNLTCKADGVVVTCLDKDMEISIPKTLLQGMDKIDITLRDPLCTATENSTHFMLKTSHTECGTTSRDTSSAMIYSNTVSEKQNKSGGDLIERLREVDITFSCAYSKYGTASPVGFEAKKKILSFSEKNFGKFKLKMDMFPDESFKDPYTKEDFPVAVINRERVFFGVSVVSSDKNLAIMAVQCYATPDQNYYNPIKYIFIKEGCAKDKSVIFYKSAPGTLRFSLEAFTFTHVQPYIFAHCIIRVCNASDDNSRCAEGCKKEFRRKREVSDQVRDENEEKLYSLSEGPVLMDEVVKKNTKTESKKNLLTTGMMAAISGLCCVCLLALVVIKHTTRVLKNQRGYTLVADHEG